MHQEVATMQSVRVKSPSLAATICALVLVLLIPYRTEAQVLYGSVVGVVADQSGAAVPGAPIRLASQETCAVREVVSDSEGRFSTPNALPGSYSLTVSAPNFNL